MTFEIWFLRQFGSIPGIATAMGITYVDDLRLAFEESVKSFAGYLTEGAEKPSCLRCTRFSADLEKCFHPSTPVVDFGYSGDPTVFYCNYFEEKDDVLSSNPSMASEG